MSWLSIDEIDLNEIRAKEEAHKNYFNDHDLKRIDLCLHSTEESSNKIEMRLFVQEKDLDLVKNIEDEILQKGDIHSIDQVYDYIYKMANNQQYIQECDPKIKRAMLSFAQRDKRV